MSGSSDLLSWGNQHTLTSFEVVKQNLSYVGSFKPPALGKLTHMGNSQVFKLKLNHASVLRPDNVGKLTLNANFLSV